VLLNRAVAVAMRDGPEAGLVLVGPLIETGGLDRYHLAHAVKADLLRRTGDNGAARASYAAALELTRQEPERRLLQRRMAELDGTEEKF
jgi:RNA polymerase sigma-70 factor (ECF subfamily)